jgi:sugar/nucleoside kinase (ribokinase family)
MKNNFYDVITFGAASEDIYLKSKKFFPVSDKYFQTGKGLCFTAGSKIEIEDVFLCSGGGGTNSAATFANQGLKVAYCGMIGYDYFGNSIIRELEDLKVKTSLMKKNKNKKTNTSVILTYPGKDKTALVYRGASDSFGKNDIPWREIKAAKWFYMAPSSGKLGELTEYIIDFAKKNKIKVAFNPGYSQLKLPLKQLKRILSKIDILILNQEEASLITKIPFNNEKGIFKKLDGLTQGICIMTKGSGGAVVSDGKYLYSANSIGAKLVDSTGAGDSFGSGFVSGFIKTGKIVYAIQLAMANSVSNIKEFGSKEGLLKGGQGFTKVKVVKISCGPDNICIKKQ